MKLLSSNEIALKKRFPKVLEVLLSTECRNSSVEYYKKGRHTFLRCGEGEATLYPYGKKNPKKLIERWLKGVELSPATCYALCGFGLGIQVEMLLERAASDALFFLIEKDSAWLRLVLSSFDYSKVLRDKRFCIVTGAIADNFFAGQCGWNLQMISDSKPLIYAPLYNISPEYYGKSLVAFARYLSVEHRLQHTNLYDGELWQERILENFRVLLGAPDISETRNLFKDLPVILVAAGPSLDESIDFIKKAYDKAVIVCVNTAYRALMEHGIRPHITVAADPRDSTFLGYKGYSSEEVYLMAPYLVNPKVVEAFRGRTFTWSTNNFLVSMVHKKLKMGEATQVLEKGTVSATIFSLASLWGCRRICFVGLDLAITKTGKSHTEHSFYADNKYRDVEKSHSYRVPGNVLDEVLAEQKLFVYLKTINQLVKDFSDIEYVNTAPLGAKIEGVPYKAFDEALAWLEEGTSSWVTPRLGELCQPVMPNADVDRKLEKGLECTHAFSVQLFSMALDAALYVERLPKKLSNANYEKHPGIQRADKYVTEIKALMDRHPLEFQILMEGKGKKALHTYMNICKKWPSVSEHWDRVGKHGEYFWALAESSYFLASQIMFISNNPNSG